MFTQVKQKYFHQNELLDLITDIRAWLEGFGVEVEDVVQYNIDRDDIIQYNVDRDEWTASIYYN